MRSGVPLPRTSYRVVMPSMTAVATLLPRRFTAQRPAGAHVVAHRLDRIERVGAHVRISLGAIVDRGREIADRRGHGSHAAVEPWPAAEAADYGNRHRGDDGGAGRRPGVSEIEERRAGRFERSRLVDEARRPGRVS